MSLAFRGILAMKSLITFVVSLVFTAGTLVSADQTWTGKIGDSMCGATHKSAAEHGGKKMSDRDCTLACVKNGGKYIFVSNGKVYNIENQDLADLNKHAGHTVKITGEMTGDTIKVAKVTMVSKS
jgi:hypothetical protein